MRCNVIAAIGILSAAVCCLAAADDPVSYEKQIQPILSRACFQCHGPDDAARKAKLRLDQKESAFANRDSGAPIVPGKPDESELIRRITSTDPDEQMPPPKHGERLSDANIALMRSWIASGADWSKHWAFIPPQRPAVPEAADSAWPTSDIDKFILARIEQEGLHPSPAADRDTLIRRLYLDLIGLPPTLDELAQAQSDTSDGWYNALVERLLASPHYGERWARHWLDAAQYADSDGFEKDKPRQVWAWRDWVIDAFNDELAVRSSL